jgi:hypothetical protein
MMDAAALGNVEQSYDVRLNAETATPVPDVRFTPESGHELSAL